MPWWLFEDDPEKQRRKLEERDKKLREEKLREQEKAKQERWKAEEQEFEQTQREFIKSWQAKKNEVEKVLRVLVKRGKLTDLNDAKTGKLYQLTLKGPVHSSGNYTGLPSQDSEGSYFETTGHRLKRKAVFRPAKWIPGEITLRAWHALKPTDRPENGTNYGWSEITVSIYRNGALGVYIYGDGPKSPKSPHELSQLLDEMWARNDSALYWFYPTSKRNS